MSSHFHGKMIASNDFTWCKKSRKTCKFVDLKNGLKTLCFEKRCNQITWRQRCSVFCQSDTSTTTAIDVLWSAFCFYLMNYCFCIIQMINFLINLLKIKAFAIRPVFELAKWNELFQNKLTLADFLGCCWCIDFHALILISMSMPVRLPTITSALWLHWMYFHWLGHQDHRKSLD